MATYRLPANLDSAIVDEIKSMAVTDLIDFYDEETDTFTLEISDISDMLDISLCNDCDTYVFSDELQEVCGGDNYVCHECRDCYRRCDSCGYIQHEDNCEFSDNGSYCSQDCYDECEGDDDGNAYWDKTNSDMPVNTTKSIKSRYFGVEIETSAFHGEPDENDLSAWFDGTEDGSISGVEIVSAKLIGDNGLKVISNAMKIAKTSHDADVDKQCGFHIHIDIRDYSVPAIKRLYDFCVLNEEIFASVVAESRRSNSFCKPLRTITNHVVSASPIEAVLELTKDDFCILDDDRKKYMVNSFKKDKYMIDRYVWANFGSFGRYGTIEIRLHTGTTDARKITNWAKLWTCVVDDIKRNKLSIKKYKSIGELILSLSYNDKIKRNLAKYYEARRTQFAGIMIDGYAQLTEMK